MQCKQTVKTQPDRISFMAYFRCFVMWFMWCAVVGAKLILGRQNRSAQKYVPEVDLHYKLYQPNYMAPQELFAVVPEGHILPKM